VTIDVVVVTHNTRELTLRCVESIVAADGRDGLALGCTVVDNASEDGTAEAIAERFPDVRVLRNAGNAGYGSACNQGLAGGDGELVLILNSDVVAKPGAIAALAEFLTAHPGHALAGARLVDPGTDRVQVGHVVRAYPRLGAQAAQMLGLERRWPHNPVSRRYLMLDLDYERTQDVEQPPGSCLAIRRSEFDAVGGFDEGFFYWYEDVDLVKRLAARGRVAYVSDATFEHVGGATFGAWSRPELIETWYPSLFRYFDKHHPLHQRLALRALAASLAAVRMAAYAVYDRERARACWRVLKLAVGAGRYGSG
jgi:GT2 family glycosyltransferase